MRERWLSRTGSTRTLGLLSVLGIALGVALLACADPLSSRISRTIGEDAAIARPPVRPSPTWAPMPTRARATSPPESSDTQALHDLRFALLRRDLEDALRVWEENSPPSPPYRSGWYQSGARLFLALGQSDRAETLIWNAIVLAPSTMDSWMLLHLISKNRQDWQTAEYALEVALSLEPRRADDLFWDRWLLAVETEDVGHMAALAESFALRHPEDPLQAYLSAKVLLASGMAFEAANRLIDALERDPNGPVLLWYTLGEAYLKLGAYSEARSVLEIATKRFYEGDETATSLEPPFLDTLNFRLARAYLGSGECANAEAVFRRLADSETSERGVSRFDAWVQQAVRCQTPTPTLTPWIPKQYGTATPVPPQE